MKYFAILSLLLLIGCKDSGSEISEKYLKNSKGEIYAVIIPEKNGWGTIPSNLSKDEVIKINKILPLAVKQMNIQIRKHYDKGEHTWPSDSVNLAEYKRQYSPYINNKGEKEVYIFCFCMEGEMKWKDKIINPDGGGKCFFRGTINLESEQFEHFMINDPM